MRYSRIQEIVDAVLSNDDASRWNIAKKNRAMETLFVECVDGNPYSRWWVPMAAKITQKASQTRGIKHLLNRVTGGAKGRGEQKRSFMKEEK